MNHEAEQKAFNFMLSNFEMISEEMSSYFKSLNWDALPNGYSDLIKIGLACSEMRLQYDLMML